MNKTDEANVYICIYIYHASQQVYLVGWLVHCLRLSLDSTHRLSCLTDYRMDHPGIKPTHPHIQALWFSLYHIHCNLHNLGPHEKASILQYNCFVPPQPIFGAHLMMSQCRLAMARPHASTQCLQCHVHLILFPQVWCTESSCCNVYRLWAIFRVMWASDEVHDNLYHERKILFGQVLISLWFQE